MKKYAVAALLALPAFPATAQVCRQAAEVVACFHPTASYVGCDQYPDDTATIYFRGGITGRPYQMNVSGQKANGFGRIVLLADNAAIPPNPNCAMQQWNPLILKHGNQMDDLFNSNR